MGANTIISMVRAEGFLEKRSPKVFGMPTVFPAEAWSPPFIRHFHKATC